MSDKISGAPKFWERQDHKSAKVHEQYNVGSAKVMKAPKSQEYQSPWASKSRFLVFEMVHSRPLIRKKRLGRISLDTLSFASTPWPWWLWCRWWCCGGCKNRGTFCFCCKHSCRHSVTHKIQTSSVVCERALESLFNLWWCPPWRTQNSFHIL